MIHLHWKWMRNYCHALAILQHPSTIQRRKASRHGAMGNRARFPGSEHRLSLGHPAHQQFRKDGAALLVRDCTDPAQYTF